MKTLPPEIFMLAMLGSLLAGVLVARWVVASAKPRCPPPASPASLSA